jgi:hypothetical protein
MTHDERPASLKPSADVIFREIEGEAVLLDLASGRYFGLNAVGTRVWTLLVSGVTVGDAIAAISAEFDAEPDRIARDVAELIDELMARRLVAAAPSQP